MIEQFRRAPRDLADKETVRSPSSKPICLRAPATADWAAIEAAVPNWCEFAQQMAPINRQRRCFRARPWTVKVLSDPCARASKGSGA